ncbi:hypothetical protein BO70DRAFT_379306 [Aspergillus heteromorphus CBS 117.55]|uniref:Uncharacterized protein n=1 Tax=Aspergillus heteromorphus CBS 117.55 TaxID=1448321 RepID=A0A317WCM3_9EURO|nr:uncharacterized protein BO70DRAFT_379306 [Aspergillus heteromorphus CBS 117.55]PWY83511.1 hypothetical protein BO70DRAFT_379306 [Aspergillus heteromorphus CBS 117.55]
MPRISPLTTTFLQSTLLNALANILAQIIDHHWKAKDKFTLNNAALIQFIIYGILIVPINFYWQRWLERRFPGFPFRRSSSSLSSSAALAHGHGHGHGHGLHSYPLSKQSSTNKNDVYISIPTDTITTATATTGTGTTTTVKEKPFQPRSRITMIGRMKGSPWYNFTMKFLLDQSVGSVMNIVLFVVLINLLKGEGVARVGELVLEDFNPIMLARLKYRPVVSMLMYTVVPVDRRVVFGSACGVVWGVYLSLYAVV